MRVLHWCMLAVTILLLVCEVIFSQLCKSLITLVDGFHTLFILMCMALPPPQTTSILKPPLYPLESPSTPPAESSIRPPPCTQTTTDGATPPPTHNLTNYEAASLVTTHQLSSPEVAPPPLDCGVSYTNSRIQPLGTFFSTLLLASLCISYLIEIISFCLQPHAVQCPLLLVVVGAVSLLHKMLLLWRNWDQLHDKRAGMHGQLETESHIEVNHTVLAKEETKDQAEPGRVLDDVNQVQSAADNLLHNEALVLCNPGASSIPNTDSQIPEQQPEVHLHVAAPQDSGNLEIDRHARDLKVYKCTSHSRNITGIFKDNTCMGHCEGRNVPKPFSLHAHGSTHSNHTKKPSSQQPFCILSSLFAIQGLLTSLLALTNSLVMLLIGPQYLHSDGACSLLVYLDPGLSLLAVIMLISTARPQMCRYGLLLLQATPPHICVSELERMIVSVPGVQAVHDLHIWQLAESLMVASVHVHCSVRFPAHRCADLMSGVTKVLQSVGVSCCTVQPEFASCSESSASSGSNTSPVGHRQDHSLPPLLACSLACGKACAGSMCCSRLEEDTRSLLAPPAGEIRAELQTLVIEKTGGK